MSQLVMKVKDLFVLAVTFLLNKDDISFQVLDVQIPAVSLFHPESKQLLSILWVAVLWVWAAPLTSQKTLERN